MTEPTLDFGAFRSEDLRARLHVIYWVVFYLKAVQVLTYVASLQHICFGHRAHALEYLSILKCKESAMRWSTRSHAPEIAAPRDIFTVMSEFDTRFQHPIQAKHAFNSMQYKPNAQHTIGAQVCRFPRSDTRKHPDICQVIMIFLARMYVCAWPPSLVSGLF